MTCSTWLSDSHQMVMPASGMTWLHVRQADFESLLPWQQALIQVLEPTVDAAADAGGAAEQGHAGSGQASPEPAQQVCDGMADCSILQPQARCVCPLQQALMYSMDLDKLFCALRKLCEADVCVLCIMSLPLSGTWCLSAGSAQ